MDNLKHVTDIVKEVLEQSEDARNSDYILYFEVCRVMNPKTLSMQFGHVLKCRDQLGLPALETVGRARRKIVEKNKHLAGSSNVETQRLLNEETFREYSKAVIV